MASCTCAIRVARCDRASAGRSGSSRSTGTTWSASPTPAAERGLGAARWLATAGGLGYFPFAPGSLTSLVVVGLVWVAAPSTGWLLAAAALVIAAGVWAAGLEEARVGRHDPTSVVIDEVAGMLVALIAAPPGLVWIAVLFLLFRVFDVWKPYPIDRLQDLPGGWGIVADDLLAGVYAMVLARLIHLVWSW
jgi:phosphatidylglycerophosphatase A